MPTRMSASAVPASLSSIWGNPGENSGNNKNNGSNGIGPITPIISIISIISIIPIVPIIPIISIIPIVLGVLRGLLVFAALEVIVGDTSGCFFDRGVEVAEAIAD